MTQVGSFQKKGSPADIHGETSRVTILTQMQAHTDGAYSLRKWASTKEGVFQRGMCVRGVLCLRTCWLVPQDTESTARNPAVQLLWTRSQWGVNFLLACIPPHGMFSAHANTKHLIKHLKGDKLRNFLFRDISLKQTTEWHHSSAVRQTAHEEEFFYKIAFWLHRGGQRCQHREWNSSSAEMRGI